MAYPRHLQIFKLEGFPTIVNDFKPLTIVAKFSISDICGGRNTYEKTLIGGVLRALSNIYDVAFMWR